MIRSIACLLMCAGVAPAQDWPEWRGADRDGKVKGFTSPGTWPKALEKGWRVEVGTGHATPALVGKRLYVHARQGEQEVILCLDAGSGKEVWRDAYAAPYKMDPSARAHGKGPKSSPAVSGDRVFTFGISGIVSCVDATSGELVWRNDFRSRFPGMSAQFGTAASPLVRDGLCIVHVGGKGKGALVALDVATGETKWSWDGDGPGYTSPVIAEVGGKRHLITQTQDLTIGVDPASGRLLWKMEYKTAYEQNSVTPVMAGANVIVSGYRKGTTAYRLGGGGPSQAWHSNDVSLYMSTGVLKDGRMYGFSEKKRGQFFCLDVATGRTLWLGEGRQGENAAVLDVGSAFLGLTTASELVVFDANPKAYLEKARYKVADTPTWAHPVVSGRAIFVKSLEHLTRWELP